VRTERRSFSRPIPPEGEEYLGTREMTVATSEVAEFKKRAEKAELIVIAFP
jgi:hypothetical protein